MDWLVLDLKLLTMADAAELSLTSIDYWITRMIERAAAGKTKVKMPRQRR